MTGCIVGWAHTPFGRLDSETVESLVVKAASGALADAGIAAADVDEIVLGHFNAGFSPQAFTASLVLHADPNLRLNPATRYKNPCPTPPAPRSPRTPPPPHPSAPPPFAVPPNPLHP